MFYVITKRTTRLILMAIILVVIGLYYLYVFPGQKEVGQDLVEHNIVHEEPEVVVTTGTLQRTTSQVVEVQPLRTDFFSEYRWERERSRSRQTSYLKEVLSDGTIQPSRQAEMEAKLWHLTQLAHKETELENLIKSKGRQDVVVVLTGDTASIVVDGSLDGSQAAQIGELVNRIANVSLERITIIDGLK